MSEVLIDCKAAADLLVRGGGGNIVFFGMVNPPRDAAGWRG